MSWPEAFVAAVVVVCITVYLVARRRAESGQVVGGVQPSRSAPSPVGEPAVTTTGSRKTVRVNVTGMDPEATRRAIREAMQGAGMGNDKVVAAVLKGLGSVDEE